MGSVPNSALESLRSTMREIWAGTFGPAGTREHPFPSLDHLTLALSTHSVLLEILPMELSWDANATGCYCILFQLARLMRKNIKIAPLSALDAQIHSVLPPISSSQPQPPPFTQSIRNATPGPIPLTADEATLPSSTGILQGQIHAPARGRAPAPKKTQIVKSDRMRLETMGRNELAGACLSLHNLEDHQQKGH
ncbi:hypothetical protein FRC11_001118, partial [Ceratobasidium sp. 423]